MRKLGVLIIGIFFLLSTFKPTVGIADTEIPEVIINELAWAGSSASSSDEWIELRNTTGSDIDIAGWQLTKNTGTETVMVTIPTNPDLPNAHIIPAEGYFLIANNGSEHDFGSGKLSTLNIEPNYITTAVTLANDKLHISLYNGIYDTEGVLIDRAGDGGAPFFGSVSAKTTMERNNEIMAGELPAGWHEANTAINLDAGVSDRGTPLAINSLPMAAAPHLTKIIPDTAETETILTITEIMGENFVTSGTTQLKLSKGDLAIWGTDITVINPTSIQEAEFDLHAAEVGQWDLIIINPDGQTATLPNALEIVEPEEDPIIPTYSDQIILSELYPHPESGQEEFIELYNQGDNSVNLNGWKLDDQTPGGSAVYTIKTDTILGPHQYLTFPKSLTHISLNDMGDYARLLWPNDTVLAVTPNYGVAETGLAYAKFDSNWRWTQRVTPNLENIYENIAEEEEDEPVVDTDPNSLQANEITILLSQGKSTDNSLALTWKINLPGALSELKIYQSSKKGVLGLEVGKTTPEKISYPLNNLLQPDKPFFTLVGLYNIQDIKSNQIEITSTNKTPIKNSIGTSGTFKQILITELLPNPLAGEEEFIEIYNPSNQTVDISGWQLLDASGKIYVINTLDLAELTITTETSAGVVLAPQQYLLLEYPLTRIRLNNSGGEEVQLLDGAGNLIDEVAYDGSAKPGHVYVLAPNSTWFWSEELTPGEPNDISFASDENSGNYLVDSGFRLHWPIFLWLSALFSAIMLAYGKRFYLYHR